MNGSWLLVGAVTIAISALSGCDLASSARESVSKARQSSSTASATPPAGVAQTAEKSAAPAPAADASGYLESTFDDIKFEMEKTDKFEASMLSPKVAALFGKRIRIRGYMYPTLRKRGLTEFVLVRDNLECCFGPGAALFDCIVVRMAPGKTAEYSIRPIAVEGTFRFEELSGPDGRPLAIYQMVGDAVQ
jgi:hypothetical protein